MFAWIARALKEQSEVKPHPPRLASDRIKIKCDDYGPGEIHVVFGDADGSGEAPCVQIELYHDYIPGGCAAMAMTARESALVERALATQRARLQPHEMLRARHRKWKATR